MNTTTAPFSHNRARREILWLLLALYGPSGGGKTKSALRLADGIRRVSGKKTFVIDTEARRALHYAEEHDFEHVPFAAPFGSLRYLDAIEYCVSQGAGQIVVDSMSHEHEGPGGLLEAHGDEVERLSRGDSGKAERVKMLAWQKPKSDRRRMINTILQLPVHFIFCFRAKEKMLLERGKDPQNKGFMPITGEEFVYEMTATALLMPCADGVPTWQSKEIGESMMIKKPAYFRPVLDRYAGKPLCEEIGEAMALWAKGTDAAARTPGAERLAAAIVAASSRADIKAIGDELAGAATTRVVTAAEQRELRAALAARVEALRVTATSPPTQRPPSAQAAPPEPVTDA